jgi:hypothetical protein
LGAVVDDTKLYNWWWIDWATIGWEDEEDGWMDEKKNGVKERKVASKPFPPTPHMRACFGCWRTVRQYSLLGQRSQRDAQSDCEKKG